MSNFDQQEFKSYSLPPDYHIRLATKQDYWAIYKCRLLSYEIVKYCLACIYFISVLLMMPACYSKWEILQKSIAFESGTLPPSSLNLSGWLYILFEASKFALLTSAIIIGTFFLPISYNIFWIDYNLIWQSKRIFKIIG